MAVLNWVVFVGNISVALIISTHEYGAGAMEVQSTVRELCSRKS